MNNEINLILEGSFLKELIGKGVTIFYYQNNSLYYVSTNTKVKADIQVTKEEVFYLAKKIASLFGENFNNPNPNITISNNDAKLAVTQHHTKNISFYLDITKTI